MKKLLLYNGIFLSLFLSLVLIGLSNSSCHKKPIQAKIRLEEIKPVNDTSLVNRATKEREKRELDKNNKRTLESKNQNKIVTSQKVKMGGGVGDTLSMPITY